MHNKKCKKQMAVAIIS